MNDLPFSFPEGYSLVPLPIELLNEPYTAEDNAYRPEIVIRRRKYFYCSNIRGSKRATIVSILNIYDTYGLSITLSFIAHLWRRYSHSRLHAYIEDSLIVLGYHRDELPVTISTLVIMIVRNLIRREEQWPVIAGSDTAVELPLELIAKITGSERLSHAVTKQVWMLRRVPPYPEAIRREIHSVSVTSRRSDGSYWCTSNEGELTLEYEDSEYVLKGYRTSSVCQNSIVPQTE